LGKQAARAPKAGIYDFFARVVIVRRRVLVQAPNSVVAVLPMQLMAA